MKNNITSSVVALAVLAAGLSFAETPENSETLVRKPSIELPSVETGLYYRSMKTERGMVENKESVFGYEVELEWYGLFGGAEACYDMTGISGRRGRYNEVESCLGYGYAFGDFTAKAAYVYKRCVLEEPDTQEVELEFEYETPWVTPFLEFEIDTKQERGAIYGASGISHTWEICERLTAIPLAGVGFGNAKRNEADFETDRCAFRDIHLGLELEIEICPHLKLVPSVDLYDQFTSAARHEYRKGFAAAGGCRLVAEF